MQKFGDHIEFGEPKRLPKGWYAKKANIYIQEFLKAIKEGKCKTGMVKIPSNPTATRKDKMSLYHAIKSMRRRKKIPLDIAIIENDLWLIYEKGG